MKNIVRIANDFIIEHDIHELPLHKFDLIQLCKSIRCRAMPYSYALSCGLIDKLNAYEYLSCAAFCVHSGEGYLILFDDTRSVGTQIFAFAHEIGHIVLNHTYSGSIGFSGADTVQENEANAFAYALLAPLDVLHDRRINTIEQIEYETLLDRECAEKVFAMLSKYKSAERNRMLVMQFKQRPKRHAWRKRIIAAAVCIVVLSVLFIAKLALTADKLGAAESTADTLSISAIREKTTEQTIASTMQSESTTTPPAATEATVTQDASVKQTPELPTQNESETVYITQHGARYHKIDCYQIRDNSAYAVTLSEAIALGKTPCKSCYGN